MYNGKVQVCTAMYSSIYNECNTPKYHDSISIHLSRCADDAASGLTSISSSSTHISRCLSLTGPDSRAGKCVVSQLHPSVLHLCSKEMPETSYRWVVNIEHKRRILYVSTREGHERQGLAGTAAGNLELCAGDVASLVMSAV